MNITVRLFARVRELVGTDTVRVELPARSAVSKLRAALAEGWPAIAPLVARSAMAVNGEYVTDDNLLSPADEIALIPPVSGGAG
jgi:molybdopterin converting factor subunit 1